MRISKKGKRRNRNAIQERKKNISALFLQSLTIQKVYLKEIKIKKRKKENFPCPLYARTAWVPAFGVSRILLMCLYWSESSDESSSSVLNLYFLRRQGEKKREEKSFAGRWIRNARAVRGAQLKFIKIYYSSFFMALLEAKRWVFE